MAMDTLKELLRRGFSKYRIAKEVGVSWNTVQLWSKGVYKPKEANLKKMEELFKNEISRKT